MSDQTLGWSDIMLDQVFEIIMHSVQPHRHWVIKPKNCMFSQQETLPWQVKSSGIRQSKNNKEAGLGGKGLILRVQRFAHVVAN